MGNGKQSNDDFVFVFCVCVEKFKSCEKAVKVFIKSIIIQNPKLLRELKTESRPYLHIEIIIRYK